MRIENWELRIDQIFLTVPVSVNAGGEALPWRYFTSGVDFRRYSN
jgi:hypothetical protein